MDPQILNYIKSQRVGVFAIEMLDGSPHAATVHFAHQENPLIFYFETHREYRKAEALFGREKSRASFVIGSNEAEPKTFQMDGIAELVPADEVENYNTVYFGKFPEKKKKSDDPKFVYFKFTPNWWRYTDFKGPTGKIILTSS
jgi:general stress protein 26